MNAIIILIIFLSLLILIFLIGFSLLFFKNFTKIVIFMPDGKIYSKKYFKNITSDMINTNYGMYKIDYKKSFRTKFGYTLFYIYNNPIPIDIDFKKKNIDTGFSSIDIKNFYESNLIEKLFKTENLEKVMFILIIIILILLIVSIAIPFFQKPSTVTLTNNINNTEIIKNACIQAIKGI